MLYSTFCRRWLLAAAVLALPTSAGVPASRAGLDDLKPRGGGGLTVFPPEQREADRAALLRDVHSIAAPGAPGGVTAFGPGAFAVVGGKEGKDTLSAVVAAARFDKGRVVAFGHGGYFSATGGEESDKDTAALLRNALIWSAAGTAAGPASHSKPGSGPGSGLGPGPGNSKAAEKLRVAVAGADKLAAWLKAATQEKEFSAEAVKGDWERRLAGTDVLVLDAGNLQPGQVEPVLRFVKSGGGLVIAATGWGWEQIHKGKSLTTGFAGNSLLAPAGLVFNNTTPETTADKAYTTTGQDLAFADATRALDAVTAGPGKPPAEKALPQISATLGLAIRSVPPDDKLFRPRLEALKKKGGAAEFPAPGKPMPATAALARLLFSQEVSTLMSAPPERTPASPAADGFPGKVPAEAPRVTKKLKIDTAIPGWHSTGLYAAPGQAVKMESPAAVTGKGFEVRIGCHTDALWHKDKWPRSPVISRQFPVSAKTTIAANAFGGLIYIDVPEKQSGSGEFTLSGAVEAPLYVLGTTTDAEWAVRRKAPGPWAELACGRLILSVPSDSIRNLRNPAEVMQFWDEVVKAEDTLASTDRRRPERIVADVEISAGYMHSGYPIMTYLDVVPMVSDITTLRQKGSWGHFHELGHNHQEGDWTPDGTVEVTCNIFTLYAFEKVCGQTPAQARNDFTPEAMRKKLAAHLASGANLERWKDDPFLALILYIQLQQAFGWEPFIKVFAEYKTLSANERPKTEAGRHGQFMLRFSKAVGKNLGPFFKAWGLPMEDEYLGPAATLPTWMPEGWPG